MHEFETLTDAVLTALLPLKAEGLKTLDMYAGQLDVDSIDEITLQYPCIYVVADDLDVTSKNNSDEMITGVTLIIGDRNVKGSAAAAKGDTASPGVFSLLEKARGKLHRQVMITGWTQLLLKREGVLVYSPKDKICLYAARYELKHLS